MSSLGGDKGKKDNGEGSGMVEDNNGEATLKLVDSGTSTVRVLDHQPTILTIHWRTGR
jgi:hypothetical protein